MTPSHELAGGRRMADRTTESACTLCPSLRTAADLLTARLDAGSVRTSVYVALDSSGTPLYVGITGAGLVRFDQHASENAHWWLQAERLIVRHFHCRHVALDVEAYLIRALDPEWNVDRPLRNQERGHAQALLAHFDEELSIT